MLTLFILSYTLGAVVTYGLEMAYWQGAFPLSASDLYVSSLIMSLFLALIWPIGLLMHAMYSLGDVFKYGLKFY